MDLEETIIQTLTPYLKSILDKKMKKYPISLIITILLLTACSVGVKAVPTLDPVAYGVTATIAAQNAEATQIAPFPPTATATATELPTAILSPTPTEMPIFASAIQNVACMPGPYKNFGLVEILNHGISAEIIGQINTNGEWWKVKLASGNECWVPKNLVSVTKDTSKIAFVDSPLTPTPPPTPIWGGQWYVMIPRPFTEYSPEPYTITINQSGNQLSAVINASWAKLFLSGQVNPNNPTEAWVNLKMENFDYIYITVLNKDPNNSNQFRGHIVSPTGTYPFCGSRNGADLPSPCMQ